MTPPAQSYQFIFRPTMLCNLRCKYCYVGALRDCNGQIMSEKEARTCIDWMITFCKHHAIRRVSILWHGGEPLLPGIDFLANTLEYAESRFGEAGIPMSNQIQTNLLLVTERHVELFRRYFGGTIGFSWDYGSDMRVYPDGRDASADIWEKALWCREKGLKLGAICQITSENRDRPIELYRHFSEAGIPFRLGPVFPSSMEDAIEAAKTACAVIDAWLDDKNPTIEIGNFCEMVESLLTGRCCKCYLEKNCGRVLLALSPGGRIYPCSRTIDNCDIIGNFHTDTPEAVHLRRMSFYANKEDARCANCEFSRACAGGCSFHYKGGWHVCECAYNYRVLKHLSERMREFGHDCR